MLDQHLSRSRKISHPFNKNKSTAYDPDCLRPAAMLRDDQRRPRTVTLFDADAAPPQRILRELP